MSNDYVTPVVSSLATLAAALGLPRLFRAIGDARKKKESAKADAIVIGAHADAKVKEADTTSKNKLEEVRAKHDVDQEDRVFDRLMKKVDEQDRARDEKIARLELHVATLERERDEARKARDDLQRTAQELASRATSVAETLARTERRVLELTVLITGAQKQIEELRAALHVALLEKADLEAQLERERARHAAPR